MSIARVLNVILDLLGKLAESALSDMRFTLVVLATEEVVIVTKLHRL